ncbi:hypothetical protein ABZ682_27250 [Streptomyces griseoviridis]|uniref:hypothetical protein n=1 Tax=Streptomyces griseoviridis TaxID=45398 RepID=UPI0033E0CD4D
MAGGITRQGRQADLEAMVRRVAVTPDGYAMAVHLATRVPVNGWAAQVVLPPGATGQAGPGSTWDGQRLTAVPGQIVPRGGEVEHGVLWLGVSGTAHAPHSVRVTADTADGSSRSVKVAEVLVTQPGTGSTTPTSEADWPSSTLMSDGGSGGGGGGGGGGQFTCDLRVDFANQLVLHRITSDAGGGGGSGGGGTGSNGSTGYSNGYTYEGNNR